MSSFRYAVFQDAEETEPVPVAVFADIADALDYVHRRAFEARCRIGYVNLLPVEVDLPLRRFANALAPS